MSGKNQNRLLFSVVVFAMSMMCGFCEGGSTVKVSSSGVGRVLRDNNGRLQTVELVNKIADRKLSVAGAEFVLTYGNGEVLSSDEFKLTSLSRRHGGAVAKLEHKELGLRATITYSTVSGRGWIYKQIEFTNTSDRPFLLRTVDVEHIRVEGEKITYAVDRAFPRISDWGQPVYTESLWFGLEFPATRSSVSEDGFIFLRHHPGFEIMPGESYTTKKAVIGAAEPDKVKKSFMDYVVTLVPRKVVPEMHMYWNGFRVIKPPDRLGQGLEMIKYAKKLYEQTGYSFDAWSYDAGFDMYRGDMLFVPMESELWPKTSEALKTIGTPLGMWASFSDKFDTPAQFWGKTMGYELQNDQCFCLAGNTYYRAIKSRLGNIVRKYGINTITFDGMWWTEGFGCNQPQHGHLVGGPGEEGLYSTERVVENKMKIFESLREINPGIVLDLFVCQEWASPWWLMQLDGVHSVSGDTLAAGIASPWVRDELITVRDIQVYEEHNKERRQFPLWAEDLYGTQVRKEHIIDGTVVTSEAMSERWEDEYVMALPGRGTVAAANLMCSDLQVIDGSKGGLKFLGDVANWTRANQAIYRDFHLIGGNPRKLEICGYSHSDGKGRAIVALRNPYITAKAFSLAVDESLGLTKTDEKLYVNIVYPYRKTFEAVSFGEAVNIEMQDYQVMLIEVREQSRQYKGIGKPGRWDVSKTGKLVMYDESVVSEPAGSLSPKVRDGKLHLEGEVSIPQTAEKGQIQIMFGPVDGNGVGKPVVFCDGKECEVQFHNRSGTIKQDWALVDLPAGVHKIDVVVNKGDAGNVETGAWLIAHYNLKAVATEGKVSGAGKLFPVFEASKDRRMTELLKPVKCELP